MELDSTESILEISNIFRIQTYNSVMCGYFCIGFIDFMFKGNSLTGQQFLPNYLKKMTI